MPRRHQLSRVFIIYTIATVLLSAVVSLLAGYFVEDQLREHKIKDLVTQTELLAKATRALLDHGSIVISDQDISALKRNFKQGGNEYRYTIIAANGDVLVDSHLSENSMDNHGLRPEIFLAQENGSGFSERFSNSLQKNMLYFALQLPEVGGDEVYVRVSTSLDIINYAVVSLRLIIFGVGTLSALMALFLGYYILRSFSIELEGISQQADEISRGNYRHRIYTQRPEDVGQLVEAINRLARSSQFRVSEISVERNQLEVILSSMVEGVIALDQDQRIIHINAAAAQLLGISSLSVKGRPLWQHVRYPVLQKIVDEVYVTEEDARDQLVISQVGGDLVIDLYATGFINKLDDDEQYQDYLGAVIVMHDISVQKKLERVRQDFVANASHELKTPLAAIRGMAETMEDDPQMPEDIRRSFVSKINRQIQRLNLLLTELLDLSKLESKNVDLNREYIDLNALGEQVIIDLRPLADDKNLDLEYRKAPNELSIYADRTALEQMLHNLLNNAIKYTVQGYVRLVLSAQHMPATGPVAKISVQDSGEGISSAHQSRIFERFYRVDRARSRDLGGNGLGLSIVKHIVDQHGGSIALHSKLGEGSRFDVIIPLDDGPIGSKSE